MPAAGLAPVVKCCGCRGDCSWAGQALRAGYNPKTANEQAARLLANVSLRAAIARAPPSQLIAAAPAEIVMICLWCQAEFQPRRGASPQRFCCAGHRSMFWAAARRSAERAVTAGVLTVQELRDGPTEACTLLPGAKGATAVEPSRLTPPLDRQRPFAETWGPAGLAGYEQDGRRFNPGGEPLEDGTRR
jgi:hypothetical protein